jgi:hypothetical protein
MLQLVLGGAALLAPCAELRPSPRGPAVPSQRVSVRPRCRLDLGAPDDDGRLADGWEATGRKESLLADIEQFKRQAPVAAPAEETMLDKTISTLGTILTFNFFVIISFFLWFLTGVGAQFGVGLAHSAAAGHTHDAYVSQCRARENLRQRRGCMREGTRERETEWASSRTDFYRTCHCVHACRGPCVGRVRGGGTAARRAVPDSKDAMAHLRSSIRSWNEVICAGAEPPWTRRAAGRLRRVSGRLGAS